MQQQEASTHPVNGHNGHQGGGNIDEANDD